MAGKLDGKIALVTGGSRGIGCAICTALGREGARVIVNFRENENAADEAVELVRRNGGEAMKYRADVADQTALLKMFDDVEAAYGVVNILVNNAGIIRDSLLVRMSDEELDAVLTTNLRAPIVAMRRVIRPMTKARWGRIVNITSVSGQAGNPSQVNYSAAKLGLVGATKALAKECANRNVTVNAVAPGFIESEMTDGLNDKVKEAIKATIPMEHFGLPQQVAHAVAFLASPEADYITGAVIDVNGGMYMR